MTFASAPHASLKCERSTLDHLACAGAAQPTAVWQRTSVVNILRQLCEDPQLLYFLFVTYDLRWEVHLNAVQALVKCLASIVESYVRAPPDGVEEEAYLAVLASAYQSIHSKGHGATHAKQDARLAVTF